MDHTLLCSVCPMDKALAVTAANMAAGHFDQIDDDFAFKPGANNTRTFWRPMAKPMLRFFGLFATQHVLTAAQTTYTDNVMARLDPDGNIFASVTDRDKEPSITKIGKDLSLVVGASGLGRAILFDDKTYNFDPQPDNGVLVTGYTDVQADDWEMVRIAAIVLLALLAPDVRPVLRWFQRPAHIARFAKKAEEDGKSR